MSHRYISSRLLVSTIVRIDLEPPRIFIIYNNFFHGIISRNLFSVLENQDLGGV